MKPTNEQIALDMMEENDMSFEAFESVIRRYELTETDVLDIFDEIESIAPHATFENVDRLLALTA